MPAINVARTDTFEIQRQKINEIGSQIFNITQGGSDLATGNLKLGDGTRTAPSLAFSNDDTLGLYRPDVSQIEYVASGKRIIKFGSENNTSYRDFIFQKNSLTNSGVSITNGGQNYDVGTFNNVTLTGGSGVNAVSTIIVEEFVGDTTVQGTNYTNGFFTGVPATGGTGTGAVLSVFVDGILGTIDNAGSGYVPGTYTEVPLTSGTGTNALATIVITGDVTTTGNISDGGSNYIVGDYQDIVLLNTVTTTYTVTATGTVGASGSLFINGQSQVDIDLIPGNTYRFDVSDSSNTDFPLQFVDEFGLPLSSEYAVVSKGTGGTAGAFVDLVIKPSVAVGGSIQYRVDGTPDMGADINFIAGSSSHYGSGLIADVSAGPFNDIVTVTITNPGDGYKVGDVLSAYSPDLSSPSGTGFEYTIASVTYEGSVDSITVTDIGQDYLNGDTLSASNTDLCPYGENVGSGFSFTVTSFPGKVTLSTFSDKGSGYLPNDVLSIPGTTSGLSTTLDDGSVNITVTSTANIVPGSTPANVSGAGAFAADTTVVSVVDATTLELSATPTTQGAVTFDLVPPYGEATVDYEFTVDRIGVVTGFDITAAGNGYEVGDLLSVSAPDLTNPITYTVKSGTVSKVDFTSTYNVSEFSVGDQVKLKDGEIVAVTITTSTATSQGLYQGISPSTDGDGTGAVVAVSRASDGSIEQIGIQDAGFFYAVGDTLTIPGNLAGGATPADDIVLTISDATLDTPREVAEVVSSNGTDIDYLVFDATGYSAADVLLKFGTTSPEYTINTITEESNRFSIDSGSGDTFAPSLTLYSGNTYTFDFSDVSNDTHVFALSTFRDGQWDPSFVGNVTTTLVAASNQITVSSTTGILPGMNVILTAGDGSLPLGTRVETVVDATTLVLTEVPLTAGSATVNFSGSEYTDGVTRTDTSISIQVSDSTPSTLYYYCKTHPNMGGYDNTEIAITVDPNNPKTFGSDLELTVASIVSESTISMNLVSGSITSSSLQTQELNSANAEITGELTAPLITGSTLSATNINSSTFLTLTTPQTNISGDLAIGSTLQVESSSGNLSTPGEIKTTTVFNANDRLTITDNEIASVGTLDIVLAPPVNRVAKVNSSTALIIPSGDTSDRPAAGVVDDGAIRFNTQTNQYEGYSSSTSTWSSLGGVRDLDGNTYIAAEETVGANDNTLWFYNDNVNTIRVTPQYLEFVNLKKVRSINVSSPSYTEWAAQTAVDLGDYLKYGNNLYEVTVAGTTGTTGTEPVHTSGALTNGTAELTWHSLAVSPLIFEDIEELQIGPVTSTPLTISGDLRLVNNVISTDINDLVIQPNPGKKLEISATTTITLPVGTDAERGVPSQGGIRFNTTSSQFEGYDGNNWGSLGGVKDVDQNTYIIPETSPGANENTLFFYNDNNKTLELTTTALDFYGIDTIRSVTSDEMEITASLLTLDQATTTIDNTALDRSFIHTTKQYFDIGLSAGLTVDPVLRLDNQGDVYLNVGFGTGTFNGVKVFDGDLKEFELSDARILTEKLTLVKGSIDLANSIIYDNTVDVGARTTIVAHNPGTGEKEFFEFGILDDGADIYHTEYGNIRTGGQLIVPSFEVTPNNEARLNIAISSSVGNTQTVNVTVVSNITKK